MMVEAQKIFTDTTTQDQPTDFRVLAGSYQRTVRLRNVAENENSWYLIQSSDIDVDVGSDVVETKQWSPGKVVVFLASIFVAKPTQSLPDMGPETEEFAFPPLFSALYHRNVLFSQAIEIQPGRLRRWRPQMTFDPSLLSEEEDA
jgi:hypothetical protein